MRTRSVYPMRALFVVTLVCVLALAVVVPAVGDGTYHSDHIDLAAVNDSMPLRSGFVENIHVNGPQIYAIERYVLNGAATNTTYYVTLLAYFPGSNCGGTTVAEIPTAHFTTNVSGNGVGKAQFTPEGVVDFRQKTWDLRWTLATEDGTTRYETGCVAVTLD